eukprot:6366011-Lingulodinium_polyedra.AAC.1
MQKTAKQGRVAWLKLPFHPVWHRAGLQSIINEEVQRWKPAVQEFLGDFEIKISWRNGAEHLIQRITGG